MKSTRNILLVMAMIFFSFNLLINGKAAGPLDGQVIDGSLLTSDESAFDEKPLVLEIHLDKLHLMVHIFQTVFQVLLIREVG